MGCYELVAKLGRGGMGEVWKAIDHDGEDRYVVLKFVPKELQGFEVQLRRVRETFKTVHRLNHENICPLYGMRRSNVR